MSTQQTLSIIKPDATRRNLIGQILSRFEQAELKIVAIKMIHMDRAMAEAFYAEHKGREFFEPLVEFMTSGPITVQVLEGEDAITKNREIMGVTDFTKAESGTIRADFATSVRENCVHGSDSPESASREIAFFFENKLDQ
jgi:nucleoside-diphosphate kinase